ncbi:enoyl-CoA hydratase/isomerase family protein [Candidatus Acetothermia bacterium]|nr:enoyl-CoA hydratase/isomerase family protein [Candidatus Acetothermia bacterium]MBI3644264.1 enoyl-CoA hydratase/isomerase family protein [Candidatus Acetothermia bacterium]
MKSSAIGTEVHCEDVNRVRWLTLDRPETRNGLTIEVVDVLSQLLKEAARDEKIRVVVIAGAGGAFSSGLDLKAIMSRATDMNVVMRNFHNLTLSLRSVPQPTIAAMDGPAAGFGANLALACDLRWATDRTSLGQKFVRIGLMPDGGGTYFLPRLVGLGRAFELIYGGEMIEAGDAREMGLINRVLPQEDFKNAVQEYAERLAEGPPLAFARAKQALLQNSGDLEAALKIEEEGQLELLHSQDFLEGVSSFLEKRRPKFRGH